MAPTPAERQVFDGSSSAVNHSCINLHYFTLKTDVYLVLPILSIFVVFKTTSAKRWCSLTAILRFAHPPVRSLRCTFAPEASPRRGASDKDGQMMWKHTYALPGMVRKPESCNAFFCAEPWSTRSAITSLVDSSQRTASCPSLT